jgi:hypothetical protein
MLLDIFSTFVSDPKIFRVSLHLNHVEWASCQHGMPRHQVADAGDGHHIWRVATNMLNKQWRTDDKE